MYIFKVCIRMKYPFFKFCYVLIFISESTNLNVLSDTQIINQ